MVARKQGTKVKEMNEVAVKEDAALAAYDGYASEDEAEGIGSGDLSTPWLRVLQALSPAVVDDIAKVGQLHNVASDEFYDELVMIPAYRKKMFLAWGQRGTPEEGFKGAYEPDDPIVTLALDKFPFAQWQTDEGYELIETGYIYAVAFPPGEPEAAFECVFAFARSNYKTFKKWNTLIQTQRLPDGRQFPSNAHRFRVATRKEKNDKGTFAVPTVAFENGSAAKARLLPTDTLFQRAEAFKQFARSQKADAPPPTVTTPDDVDSDIPFDG